MPALNRDQRTAVALTGAELRAAMRLAGFDAGPGSPVAGPGGPAFAAGSAAASSLRRQGIVTPAGDIPAHWRDALRVLAIPARSMSLYLGAGNEFIRTQFFSHGARIVSCTEQESRFRVAFPIIAGELADTITDWLRCQELPAIPPFREELRSEELTALAAVVDAYREEGMRALLERREPRFNVFQREQLVYELQLGPRHPDPRWLAGLLHRHAPPAFRPDIAQLDRGAMLLTEKGWLKSQNGAIGFQPGLEQICKGLGSLSPYALLEILEESGRRELELFTRGLGSLWLFVFASDTSLVLLEAMGGSLAMDYVGAQVRRLTAAMAVPPETQPSQAASSPQLTGQFCAKCGKELKPGRVFCTGCGTRIQ
jgi:hypothetical protein